MFSSVLADELADFYGVSRQSALIRMTETRYSEARSVLQAINEKDWHSHVSLEDVFYEYSHQCRIPHSSGFWTFQIC